MAQSYAKSKPMKIEEVDLAPPGEREVLVQIKAASLCHSDLSTVNGDRPRQTPMVLGHEAAGVIIECGAGVNDVIPGDHVALVSLQAAANVFPARKVTRDAVNRDSNPTPPALCWAAQCA